MNALMTIQVRVLSAQALAQLKGLDAASRRTATGVGSIGRQAAYGIPQLSKWGNQVQWAGRQLMYNFTLPIALAMGAATKFALENEKAMTRVAKVYGDGTKQFRKLAKTELPALGDAFEALSNKFGVHQQQVIEIAADWAAAGASGIALAKSVDITLQTMILGELEASEATEKLIAIQAQYGQNTQQLIKTIEILNMVENQTGISMRGLMDGMSRAAGVARTAGVDVEHLAAMMAALVPATGSAATAGNGLKTIISRILSPTKEATQVMKAMGIEVNEMSWQGMTAVDRLQAMANAYDEMPHAAGQLRKLSDAQEVHTATVFGSRWQINRFITLMRDINNENGYYQKSLKATADEQRLFTQRQFELNRVLTSNPQMLKQTWVILQNAMARVIVPLLPYIVYLAQQLAHLANKFAALDPEIQKLVLAGLVFIAVIGPIARYVGAVSNMFGLVSAAAHFFTAKLIWSRKEMLLANGTTKVLRGGLFGLMATLTLTGKAIIAWPIMILPVLMKKAVLLMIGLGGKLINFFALRLTGAAFVRPWFMVWNSMVAAVSWAFMSMIRIIMSSGAIFSALGAVGRGLIVIWKETGVALRALWITTMAQLKMISVVGSVAQLGIFGKFRVVMIAIFIAIRNALLIVWSGLFRTLLLLAVRFNFSLMAVFALLPKFFVILGRALLFALTSPWVWAAAAVLGIVYAFRNQIGNAWNGIAGAFAKVPQIISSAWAPVAKFFETIAGHIVDAFWALPEGVRNAMIAVLTVVRDTALQVYEWMSYLNPFARHSPSLVDQVTKGMDVIGDQYGRAGTMGEGFKKAHKVMEAAIAAQERVVDRWKYKLEDANYALEIQQNKLDKLKDKLSDVQAVYDAHAAKLQSFADAPIRGMGAMNDKIFENELAQKKLRLEMMKFEQANGSIDDLRGRFNLLQGDIEMLRGSSNELRMAGAGSDVLGPINDQISAMEAQAKALVGAVNNNPVSQMQQQMEELQKQGEILQLQNDIKYDPMIHSIEKLANVQKELSYDQIVNGIERQRQAMNALEPDINRITEAVNKQQNVVDRHTAARDALSRKYDMEQRQLDLMRRKYDDLTDAMNKNGSAAGSLKGMGKGGGIDPVGVETFKAGKGANWADVGGMQKIGREGGMGDQAGLIADFAEQTNMDLANIFGSFNMFAPLKEWWNRTWAWLKEHIGPVVGDVGDALRGAVGKLPDIWRALKDQFNKLRNSNFGQGVVDAFNVIADAVRTIWNWIKGIWRLFAPDVKRIFKAIQNAAGRAWDEIGPLLASFGELIRPAVKALGNLWQIIKPVVAIIGGVFLFVLKLIASVLGHIVGPAFDMIIDIIKAFITIIRGVAKVIIGIFTWDGDMIISGIKDIFKGIVDGVWGILKGFGKIVWGVIEGIVGGIIGFFKWLYDELVGHSIVPDIVDGIVAVFKGLVKLIKWLWDKVIVPVFEVFKDLWDHLLKPFLKTWFALIKGVWKVLFAVAKWLWEHVLSPVYDKIKELWSKYVKPALALWWAGIKATWEVLKKVAIWLWDNVLKPVWDKAKDLWSKVKDELVKWWDRIKDAWGKLKELGGWIKEHVMDPIFEAFKTGWTKIKEWFNTSKDFLLKPIQTVVNGFIKAINFIISGINKLDALPGVSISIGAIPEPFAQGGIPKRRVGSGFKTNGARAIVGEGKANWPEFVIPTDPTYRNRARSLLASAAVRLGVDLQGAWGDSGKDMMRVLKENPRGAVPEFGIGGWLVDKAGDAIGQAIDIGKGAMKLGKNVLQNTFKPYLGWARDAADKITWKPGRDSAHGGIDLAAGWLGLANQVFQSEWEEAQNKFMGNKGAKNALKWARTQAGKPYIWGGVGPEGYDCSGFMSAVTNVMRGKNPHSRLGSTATFPWAGFSTQGPLNTAGLVIGSTRSYAGGVGHMAGTLGGVNVESAGGVGVRIGSAARGAYDPGFTTRAALALREGAIIKRTHGGVFAQMGEGSHDEAVVPLPRSWRTDVMQGRNSGGDTNIYINGKLEFPNIKSGGDAETFINNLKVLAKD